MQNAEDLVQKYDAAHKLSRDELKAKPTDQDKGSVADAPTTADEWKLVTTIPKSNIEVQIPKSKPN